MASSRADSTVASYATALRHYLRFDKLYPSPLPAFVIPYGRVMSFLLYLSRLPPFGVGPLRFDTISSYLSGLSWFIKLVGSDPSPLKHDQVTIMLTGIKEAQPRKMPTERLPIRVALLKAILHAIPLTKPPAVSALSYHAGACLGGVALCRAGEFSVKARSNVLLRRDFVDRPGEIKLYLADSKTDFRRHGVWIPLFECPGAPDICVPSAIRAAMAAAPLKGPDDPLFQREDGKPMTYHFFLGETRRRLHLLGLPSRSYGAHSFRIGGATELAKLGVDVGSIMLLGRWKSNAVFRYLRSQSEDCRDAIKRLSVADIGPSAAVVPLGGYSLKEWLLINADSVVPCLRRVFAESQAA